MESDSFGEVRKIRRAKESRMTYTSLLFFPTYLPFSYPTRAFISLTFFMLPNKVLFYPSWPYPVLPQTFALPFLSFLSFSTDCCSLTVPVLSTCFILLFYPPLASLPWPTFFFLPNTFFTSDDIGEWTGLEFGKSQRAVENRGKWRKLVAKSSVVPQRPWRFRD